MLSRTILASAHFRVSFYTNLLSHPLWNHAVPSCITALQFPSFQTVDGITAIQRLRMVCNVDYCFAPHQPILPRRRKKMISYPEKLRTHAYFLPSESLAAAIYTRPDIFRLLQHQLLFKSAHRGLKPPEARINTRHILKKAWHITWTDNNASL